MENETLHDGRTRELPPVRIVKRLRSIAPLVIVVALSLALLALNAQA